MFSKDVSSIDWEAVAQRIIASRPFKSVKDLERVNGIGEVKMQELDDMVTVGSSRSAVLQPGQKININTASHHYRCAAIFQ